MVTTRMTVEEHAKQLVSHGAHAADIEVVEGLLAELEKSKKVIESLRDLTRKQFGLVDSSEEGFQFEYLNKANESFIMNGGTEVYMALPTHKCHAHPQLEQCEEVVPALQKLSQESNQ